METGSWGLQTPGTTCLESSLWSCTPFKFLKELSEPFFLNSSVASHCPQKGPGGAGQAPERLSTLLPNWAFTDQWTRPETQGNKPQRRFPPVAEESERWSCGGRDIWGKLGGTKFSRGLDFSELYPRPNLQMLLTGQGLFFLS